MKASDHVGPGWAPIVQSLIERLQESAPEVRIVQIKEKFGGLRVYTDRSSDLVSTMIGEAESLCSKTCELCGKPGKLSDLHGWLKTVCEDHSEKDSGRGA